MMPLQSRSPFVLLAEDDLDLRRLMSIALRDGGYVVVEFGSGLELVEYLRDCSPADDLPLLIVSDVSMPAMSGLAALREIRSWGSKIPMIMVTGLGCDDTLDEAFRAGATAVMVKPVDFDDLRIAVRCFMPRRAPA
jgi:two-component system response regulator HydG